MMQIRESVVGARVSSPLASAAVESRVIDQMYSVALGAATCAGAAGSIGATSLSIGLASAVGYGAGRIDTRGLMSLACLGLATSGYSHTAPTWAMLGATTVGAAALAMHKVPGFRNWAWLEGARLRQDAAPYTSWVNGDKVLASAMLLCALQQVTRPQVTVTACLHATTLAVATISTLMLGGITSKFVKFDPHPPQVRTTALWVANNLLLVCAPEEALFRGMLFEGVATRLGGTAAAKAASLVMSSCLFGLAHLPGGRHYAALSTIAGAGYGLAAAVTGRLEGAIFVHFMLNLTHFMGFTYPCRG